MSSTTFGKQLPQQFNFHDDPGHGWLQVPVYALELLSITENITPFSYQQGDMAYLEEDVDAPTFIKAWLIHHDQSETDFAYFHKRCREIYSNRSFIRSLPSFTVKSSLKNG